MKKSLLWILICILVGSLLVGCGSETEPGSGGQAASAKPVEIVFASSTAPNTVENQAAEMFKKIVEEKSEGNITVKFFAGATLGGERDNLEQLKTDEIQMSILGDIITSVYAPQYDPTVIPFIFPDLQSVYDYLEGSFRADIDRELAEQGNARIIGLQQRGPRNLTANVKVETPDDLRGLKVRVPEIPTWVTVWGSMGTLPTPIAWSEVYTSLQLNVVDAQENPYQNISSAKLQEVQKYVMETEHVFGIFKWVIADDFFQSLPSEYQEIVLDAAEEAVAWGNSQVEAEEARLKEELKASGMEIVEVDKGLFAQAALEGVKEVAQDWAPGVWDEIKGYLGE